MPLMPRRGKTIIGGAYPKIYPCALPSLNHVRGRTINRQWLVAKLLALRSWFRIRGIADMAGPVAGATRSLMTP